MSSALRDIIFWLCVGIAALAIWRMILIAHRPLFPEDGLRRGHTLGGAKGRGPDAGDIE